MPISSSAVSAEKRKEYRIKGKTATGSVDVYEKDTSHKNFLKIGPACSPSVSVFPDTQHTKVLKRSLSTLSVLSSCVTYDDEPTQCNIPASIQTYPDGTVHVSRTQKAKEKNPDRICLDRRGLTAVPVVDGDAQLRLLSLQHNLLSKLDGLQEQRFLFLVFLDVYDNQLESISSLDTVESLRVLLMGKNRIKRIEGLQRITKLEVLDLHGNQITQVTGLGKLSELKVLNLAGNQIRNIGLSDLRGLLSLQELNLRRNKLRKLMGFGDTSQLQKLFLSNNEIQSVEDMSSVAKAVNLREVAIDNNPVSLGGECVSFLVSYLPQLCLLSNMQITEQVRKAAMAWRRNKESSNAAFMDLTSDVCLNVHREEIISNARTNWELLRSQTKCIAATNCKSSSTVLKDFKIETDFVLTPINKPEIKNMVPQRGKVMDKRFSGASKMCILPDKKLNFIRTSSQDTENSQNTSSSNTSNHDMFRLPPILVPIINKLEGTKEIGFKKWGSLSSLGPNVDSSSFPSSNASSSSSESESEKDAPDNKMPEELTIVPALDMAAPEKIPLVSSPVIGTSIPIIGTTNSGGTDTSSTISTATSGVTAISSNSGSDVSNTTASCRSNQSSRISSRRSIKSATTTVRSTTNSKLPSRAATAKSKQKLGSPVPPPAPPPPSKDREQGGDYLIEICGRYLNIYGQGALRFIDKSWNTSRANDVNAVKFSYVNFNNVIGYLNKLKNKFPNINSLIFCETNIYCLGQLNALAEVQGFVTLKLEEEGNPICSKKWRNYAVYRLSHWGLKTINEVDITEEEIKAANEEYQSLSDLVLSSLPDMLLQPLLARLHLDLTNGDQSTSTSTSNISAKKWLFSADPALKGVVSKEALQWRRGSVSQEDTMWRTKARIHMGGMLESVCETVDKLRLLENEWPQILNDILRNILVDYSQLDVYMKRKLSELKL